MLLLFLSYLQILPANYNINVDIIQKGNNAILEKPSWLN